MSQIGKKITRRGVLKGGAALGLAGGALGGLARPAAAADEVVYVNTWGGPWTAAEDAAFYKPFTAKTGIQVRPVSPVSYPKLKAQVDSGVYEWDCTNLDTAIFKQAQSNGLCEPIDWSVVDKSKLAPGVVVGDGIASVAYSTLLVYRKDKFPNGGPKSWADFWDVKKFPGNRSLYNQAFTALAFALLADGVPKDKLFPLDVNRAFKKLDEIKPHIKVWWTQGGQSETLIKDAEVDMIGMWHGRAYSIIDQGVPLEIVWNGAANNISYWMVAKGSPRAKLAWKFIDYTAQPEGQAEFASRMAYGPSNPKALALVKPDQLPRLPTTEEHLKLGYVADADWLQANLASINERFAQWLAG